MKDFIKTVILASALTFTFSVADEFILTDTNGINVFSAPDTNGINAFNAPDTNGINAIIVVYVEPLGASVVDNGTIFQTYQPDNVVYVEPLGASVVDNGTIFQTYQPD